MRGEGLEVRIVDLDRDQLHVRDARRQQFQRALVGGIVPLHVGDLQHLAGAVARRRDPIAAGERQSQRLLAQHVQAGFQRRDREVRVERIRRRDHHRVETAPEQALDVGMDMLEAIAVAQRRAHRGRRIRQRDELEPLALLPQIEGVLRLSHQSRPDQADAQSFHNPAPPLGWSGKSQGRTVPVKPPLLESLQLAARRCVYGLSIAITSRRRWSPAVSVMSHRTCQRTDGAYQTVALPTQEPDSSFDVVSIT